MLNPWVWAESRDEGALTMANRTELDVSQRTEAVLALLRREEPAAKLARRYGISEPTLYR